MMLWKPISEAPEDKSDVLLFGDNPNADSDVWISAYWNGSEFVHDTEEFEPTHWCEITPPSDQQLPSSLRECAAQILTNPASHDTASVRLATRFVEASESVPSGNDQESAIASLAVLVHQGWQRCREASGGRFNGKYSTILVTADGDFELSYGPKQKPVFVETAETVAVPAGDYEDPPDAESTIATLTAERDQAREALTELKTFFERCLASENRELHDMEQLRGHWTMLPSVQQYASKRATIEAVKAGIAAVAEKLDAAIAAKGGESNGS